MYCLAMKVKLEESDTKAFKPCNILVEINEAVHRVEGNPKSGADTSVVATEKFEKYRKKAEELSEPIEVRVANRNFTELHT
eukprot:snap_masked-scaffold_6-processed-gene-15.32-mRNA-1 protein AED:1.00 eAED:1.00 QI:0/-1/0/0/-1/1/1/0/80